MVFSKMKVLILIVLTKAFVILLTTSTPNVERISKTAIYVKNDIESI